MMSTERVLDFVRRHPMLGLIDVNDSDLLSCGICVLALTYRSKHASLYMLVGNSRGSGASEDATVEWW